MHDLEKIATDLSESIFTRIEQDRCLIKQTIADLIHRELVFRFGRETPESHAADRCSCGSPADDMVNLNGQSACWDCIRKAAAPKVEQALPSHDEMERFVREAKAEQRRIRGQAFVNKNGGWLSMCRE